MLLYNLLEGVQDKQEGNQLELIKLFTPLLKKYAYKLNIEDAYEILLLDFIQLITSMDLERIHNKSDGAMVKYLSKSIHNLYIKHIKNHLKINKPVVLLDDLNDAQKSFLQKKQVVTDDLFEVEYSDIFSLLTTKEIEVLMAIFVDGSSAAFVAAQFGVSRQNINQIKRKALIKLRKYVNL